MGARKIVDRGEVLRWFEEGRTYPWMSERYLEKYDIVMTPTAWSNFRRREGLPGRHVRDDGLIPWKVERDHVNHYPQQMLRLVARDRRGAKLSDDERGSMERWLEWMESEGVVVHYDPESVEGWHYVKPRPGVDTDLIRVPARRTGRRAGD